MAKWVRGYSVCPNLMLTPRPGILYSLIGPSRGLASCKQSEEQAATWLIIRQGGQGIDHLWGGPLGPLLGYMCAVCMHVAQYCNVPSVADGESNLTFKKKLEIAGLVSYVASIVKLPQQFTINEVIF